MSNQPGLGEFVVYSITLSADGTDVVLVRARSFSGQPGFVPLASEMIRLSVRGPDMDWWKVKLGGRIRLVAQDT